MDLSTVIRETEKLGVTILFCPFKTTKGRHLVTPDNKFILINQNLSDTEKVNVILHEKAHLINQDTENQLIHVATFNHRIEAVAEADRIVDFMSLINRELPIDESFNYHDFMKKAYIPDRFENIVKKEANKLFEENRGSKI